MLSTTLLSSVVLLLPSLSWAQLSTVTSKPSQPPATTSKPVLSLFLKDHWPEFLVASVVAVNASTTTLEVTCDLDAVEKRGVSCPLAAFETVKIAGSSFASGLIDSTAFTWDWKCDYTSATPATFTSLTDDSMDFAAATDDATTMQAKLKVRATSKAAGTPAAVCTESFGGSEANFPGVSTTTLDPSEVSIVPVTITAGAEKLASASASATTTSSGKAGAKASGTAVPASGASVKEAQAWLVGLSFVAMVMGVFA